MANNPSALKRVRQIKVRTEQNKAIKTKVKSLRKKTLDAAAAGNADEAQANLKLLSSAVDRAVKNNVFHKNKGANVKSKAVAAIKSGTSA
jgi:small subunit ribosomal protein S20